MFQLQKKKQAKARKYLSFQGKKTKPKRSKVLLMYVPATIEQGLFKLKIEYN